MPNVAIRQKIDLLEQALKAATEHHVHIEPTHYLWNGLYAREITIPKGTMLVGKLHKTDHMNIIASGDISVVTEGGGVERIQGPKVILSKAGSKRGGYAHEDTVWITLHATPQTDLAALESDLIAKDYEELAASDPQLKLESI